MSQPGIVGTKSTDIHFLRLANLAVVVANESRVFLQSLFVIDSVPCRLPYPFDAHSRMSRTLKPGPVAPAYGMEGRRADVSHRALDAFRRIVRQLRLADASSHARTGLSGAQLFVLLRIAAAPGSSMNELAERTLTDRSSVAALVRRLEARGLVKTAPGSADRRRSSIQITPEGRAVIRKMSAAPGDILLGAITSLSLRDAIRLTTALEQLVEILGIADFPARPLFEEKPVRARGKTQVSQPSKKGLTRKI